MISTERLYNAADEALDADPIKVLEALNAMIAFADELSQYHQTGRFFAEEIRNRIGSALGIQEGGSE